MGCWLWRLVTVTAHAPFRPATTTTAVAAAAAASAATRDDEEATCWNACAGGGGEDKGDEDEAGIKLPREPVNEKNTKNKMKTSEPNGGGQFDACVRVRVCERK
jgi:hypothetical protein